MPKIAICTMNGAAAALSSRYQHNITANPPLGARRKQLCPTAGTVIGQAQASRIQYLLKG